MYLKKLLVLLIFEIIKGVRAASEQEVLFPISQ